VWVNCDWFGGVELGCIVQGLLLATLTSIVVGLKPSSSGCGVVALYLGTCTQASTTQMFVLYLSLYTIALGLGGIRPCLSTFGADQFDIENPKEKLQLARFFNWYYLAYTLGSIFSATLVVFLYTSVSWAWAFGCLTIAMALASLLFLLGTPLYRHHLPSGSPLTRLLQVLVASTRKWRVQVPDDESLLYEVHDKESAIVGSRRLHHVHDLRYGVLHTFIPMHFSFQPLFCIIHTRIQPGNKSGYLKKNSRHWRAVVGYIRNWVLLIFFLRTRVLNCIENWPDNHPWVCCCFRRLPPPHWLKLKLREKSIIVF
jgi:MFS family permease